MGEGESAGPEGPSLDRAVAAALGGDADGFAVLYRALTPPLLRYLRVAAPGAEEDLAGQVWAEVVERMPRFRGDAAGFRGWLFTLARHRIVDAHRRRGRGGGRLPESVLEDLPAGAGVEEAVLEGEATRRALALIATLPPGEAQAVTLRVVAGLDVDQVAKVLGKRPGTVRVLCHRGLRRLADQLGAAGGAAAAPPVTVHRRGM